jgi:hypothetical protein
MSVLDKLACSQGRRDEVPNQELAKALVAAQDREGIAELAANLQNKNADIASDCIKTLYEVGYLMPGLIAEHWQAILPLLRSHHNRMAWGGMITLSTIADLQADELFTERKEILRAMDSGSVITVDNSVKVLALIAAKKTEYNRELFPVLLEHLRICRPKEVPQHAESTLPAVNSNNKSDFLTVLEKRKADLSGRQVSRIRRVVKRASES